MRNPITIQRPSNLTQLVKSSVTRTSSSNKSPVCNKPPLPTPPSSHSSRVLTPPRTRTAFLPFRLLQVLDLVFSVWLPSMPRKTTNLFLCLLLNMVLWMIWSTYVIFIICISHANFSFQFSVGADGLKQALATGQGTPPAAAAAAPAAPAASGKARRFIREY